MVSQMKLKILIGFLGISESLSVSGCNPFSGGLTGSYKDPNFHPGVTVSNGSVTASDSIPPTLAWNVVPTSASNLKGGASTPVSWTASDSGSGIASLSLYYAADGVAFSLLSTLGASATSYSWSVPNDSVNTAKLKLVATDGAGNSQTVLSQVFVVDSTAPSITLGSPSGAYQSGSTLGLGFTASDSLSGMSSVALEYASDGVGFSLISAPSPSATSYAWTVPADNVTTAKIRLTGTDQAGNSTTITSTAFTINSTAPIAPSVTLTSVNPTISTAATLTIDTCSGRTKVYISESSTVPANNAAGWQTCTAAAGGLTYTLSSGDGVKTLYAFAQDSGGTVSGSTSVSDVLDTVPPSLAWILAPTAGSSLRGGSSFALTWSSSDTTTSISSLKRYYAADGTTFSLDTTLANSATSLSWTVPSDDVSTAKIKLTAIDAAGNSASIVTSAFTIDSTPPAAPSISLVTSTPTNASAVTLTVASCLDRSQIYVSESSTAPAYNAAGWQTCTTTVGATPFTLSSGDGVKTLYAFAQDSVGNVSSASSSLTITLDQTAPSLSLTSFTGGQVVSGLTSQSVTWSAADATSGLSANSAKIEVSTDGGSSWTTLASSQTTSGPYSWAASNGNGSSYRIRVSVSDNAGNLSTAVSLSDFTVDSVAPVLTSGQMTLNGGAATSLSNYIQVSLKGTDTASKITAFCLKYISSSAPLAADSCWRSVSATPPALTPSTSLNLSNFYYTVGFAPGSYTVYAWIKDEAGNMSALSSSGAGTLGQDRASVVYAPGTPPSVSDVLATNKDAPSDPPSTSSDLTVAANQNIYIKWKASSSTGLGTNPISIYYTTDESTYTLVASNLSNAANGSCTVNHPGTTVDDQDTGCYLWSGGNPSSAFRIRVVATDGNGFSTVSASTYLNLPSIRFIAGNFDPGLGGSAFSAMFYSNIAVNGGADSGSLAVASDGTIYFRDIQRGLLKVDPQTGNQTLVVATSGTQSGDGGPVTSASFKYPYKITLDAQDRVLVWDYDRIRLIDTTVSPNTISTLIGGGTDTADTTTASAVKITGIGSFPGAGGNNHTFFSMPNGDVYFMSESSLYSTPVSGYRVRVYRAATAQVISFKVSGTGDTYNASQDLTKCNIGGLGVTFNPNDGTLTSVIATVMHSSTTPLCTYSAPNYYMSQIFDPTTGVATPVHPPDLNTSDWNVVVGKNGSLYGVNTSTLSTIRKFDETSHSWTTVAGTGALGACADGTVATSCAMNPNDIYVTAQGLVYFVDRGKVRIIDNTGKVQTIAGQGYNSGDGSTPLSARFGLVQNFGVSSADQITIIDRMSYLIREFPILSGTLSTIAGNGSNGIPSTSTAATSNPIYISFSGMTGDYFQEDPATGDIFLQTSTSVLGRLTRSTGKWQTLIGGGANGWRTADGQVGTAIDFSSSYTYVSAIGGGKLLVNKSAYNLGLIDSYFKIYDLSDSARQSHLAGVNGTPPGFNANGTISGSGLPSSGLLLAQWEPNTSKWLSSQGSSAAIRTLDSTTIGSLVTLPRTFSSFYYYRNAGPTVSKVFYCASGKLYKYDLLTTTETLLPQPSSMSCAGVKIYYHSARNSLIYIYQLNGLYGIAEYQAP